MSQSKIVGAVEIGTTHVVALIGEIVNGRSLNLIGMAESSSSGVKKGEITDFRAASNCVHAAIMGAEKSAGVQVEAVYLSQTGGHLQGFHHVGSVNVSSSENRVSADDIQRVIDDAKGKELSAERVYIHHIKHGFRLDGEAVDKPLNQPGNKLEVSYWSVHGDEARVRDHIHIINGFGLPVEDMILSSIATASMVATAEEKRRGSLVLDMGGGTTDWAVYRDGVIMRTGVVPVGGDHLTNDLALGLRVNRKYAEKLKKQFGKAFVEKDDKGEKVWMVGDQMIGDRYLSRQSLVQIIELRLDELFQILKKQLGEFADEEVLPCGVVLSGGASVLPGIPELAGKILGLPVRVGSNPDWVREDLRGPGYSTALGLMHYALTGQHQEEFTAPPAPKGLMKKVSKLFSI
ncbi:cell division protein FtsA [Ruficoccus amylovorans]|uniref:Cell division protein FtsA n=1 Tax=Ruficoccus amylovorans TaxID=1804625 RepID=A0A842HFF8_9BACT|nr:cell division protein FtsA [Ruficoccus amylovorans]MBC2595375.1 cell division protein FtsA [Ruficoccus amylovorans]